MQSEWKLSNIGFVLLTLLFLFQIPLTYIMGLFKYWDELCAASVIPLFFAHLRRHDYQLTIKKTTVWIVMLLIFFSICGLTGTFLHKYQPMKASIMDWFLHMKFFFVIAASYILFEDIDTDEVFRFFWPLLMLAIFGIFCTVVLDMVAHIFPATYRLGLRAEAIFYGHPTSLAAIGFFLLAMLFRMYEYVKERILPFLLMISFVIVFTLRAKAWGGLIFAFFIYIVVIRKRRSFGVFAWLFSLSGVAVVAARQITQYYSVDNMKEARGVLTIIGARIAKDYFPFGTGFATFGSAYSAEPYSKVYFLYHLDNIWGLSRKYPAFISDTFWPMIMGQSGILGTVLYALIIFMLALKILQLRRFNVYTYASALTILVYLLISSTSESSFVNPMAIPLGMLLGIAFAELHKYEERNSLL